MRTRLHGNGVRLLLAVSALALMASACGGEGQAAGATGSGGADVPENLSGEVVVSGSSTVEPITARVAEKFAAAAPDVAVSVEGPGTGDGFELFCNGETDISDASRPIDPEEEAPLCKKNGIDYIEVKVGIDGISVLTHPDNDQVDCLDFYDLYALLGVESEGFENWSDANDLAAEIGAGHAPYLDAPLDITAPGEESGTYDSFAEIVLEDIAYEERGIEEDAPVVRPDYTASANDNAIIDGISGSESSLGWVGFAFFVQNEDAVRAIPIAESPDADCVEPTTETLEDGSYPIARELFFYVNAETVQESKAVEEFVDFYLSDEGMASVTEVGYVALPDEEFKKSLNAWEAKETGSREGA
jgi:phosphate transport system substrate-binding protein